MESTEHGLRVLAGEIDPSARIAKADAKFLHRVWARAFVDWGPHGERDRSLTQQPPAAHVHYLAMARMLDAMRLHFDGPAPDGATGQLERIAFGNLIQLIGDIEATQVRSNLDALCGRLAAEDRGEPAP